MFKKTVAAVCTVALLAAPANSWDLFTGGKQIKGSGNVTSEERDVKSFTKIKTAGSFDMFITVGPQQKLTLTFDDNLLEVIETEVRGKTLTLGSNASISSHRACRVDITVPSLESVHLSGSGDIIIEELKGEMFECSVAGSGTITANGEVNEVEIEVSGSGDVDTSELLANDADVSISGSGDVAVYAKESLISHISGSGDIRYRGNPKHNTNSISGSGSIREM